MTLARRALALIILSCLLAGPARAGTEVIDGDTIRVDGLTFRLTINGSDSFDTPETWKPRCLAEKMLGAKATERLRELIAGGYSLEDLGNKDRYGRGLAAVSVGGENVGKTLIREGLAVPLKGCPRCQRATPWWCDKS